MSQEVEGIACQVSWAKRGAMLISSYMYLYCCGQGTASTLAYSCVPSILPRLLLGVKSAYNPGIPRYERLCLPT